jgi:hypothetical protein
VSDTQLSPGTLLLIGAIMLPIVIESRVVINWIFGVEVPFWWTVAAGVVVYGAILFWGTLPAADDQESAPEP